MPPSAYDISIRESLQKNRKIAVTIAVLLILAAGALSTYYLHVWPARLNADPTVAYYSDDDGATYFKDKVYNFPPFDHNGKTAVRAVVAEAHGQFYVACLLRFTPDVRQRLQKAYDDAVEKRQSVQQLVLGLMNDPAIAWAGTEAKLPGASHEWMPRSQISQADMKAPDGTAPERFVQP